MGDLMGTHHDELMQDSLLEDNQATEAEGEKELRQIVKFDEEDTGENIINKKNKRGYSEQEMKAILKKQKFMGCIDNTG
jgi:hypothetical protein